MKSWLCNSIAAADWLNFEQRLAHYRLLGLQAEDAYIQSRCFFVYPDLSNITLGDRTFINHFGFLENGESISIGQDTCIGPGVQILTTTHEVGGHERRAGYGCVRRPVRIGAGCWIGAGVIILPGVSIGDGCLIGAGAIVRTSCPADGAYVGVPAKRGWTLATDDGQKLDAGEYLGQPFSPDNLP